MDILYFQGYDLLGWGGQTIMDILYFQGVRQFRLGGSHHGPCDDGCFCMIHEIHEGQLF